MSDVQRDIVALVELIEARSGQPFGWRKGRDCVSFAGAASAVQTGYDPTEGLSWTSRRTALSVIAAEGGLEAAFDKRFNRIPPALARRGDLAGVPDPLTGIRMMVVEGATLVAPGSDGLERQPRSLMTIAWDISSRLTESADG